MPLAIVTGCLGAIGGATCEVLADDGYDVIGIDRHADQSLGRGTYYACDLANAAAIAEFLEAIHAKGLRPDVLVNNAGLYEPKKLFDTTLEDFDRVYNVNVRAIFQLSQQIARWMVDDRRTGAIVNIASIAGKIGSPIMSYGMSKAAVIGLTRSLARALATDGIRVNAITPGIIESAISRSVAPEQMRTQMSITAMGRVGQPEEIARVVRFLASPEASYMTGSIVDVAGGWMT